MRLVNTPVMAPAHCAAMPHLGPSATNVRWIDTGSSLEGWQDRVYLSSPAIETMWALLGHPSLRDIEELQAENQRLRDELAAASALADQASAALRAIDALESADFRARKKAGRPKLEKV
jgi:hypothetical protein